MVKRLINDLIRKLFQQIIFIVNQEILLNIIKKRIFQEGIKKYLLSKNTWKYFGKKINSSLNR